MDLFSAVVLFVLAVGVVVLLKARKTTFWSWLMASKAGTKNRSAKILVRVILIGGLAMVATGVLVFVIYSMVFWGVGMLWFLLTGDTLFEY